jgi:thiol-disulfide isomerase/thioredoxin
MKDNTRLAIYARQELSDEEYGRYRPRADVLREVARVLPRARVRVVAAAWCKDCRREVPRFARIAERLSGWTVELLGDDPAIREALGVRRIPTFVVESVDGARELGRIVERPASGSLEDDLLAIAERHPSQIMA